VRGRFPDTFWLRTDNVVKYSPPPPPPLQVVEVTFDPLVISYEDLLTKHFFRRHDPTTLHRQVHWTRRYCKTA
jgi:hypothetical protein